MHFIFRTLTGLLVTFSSLQAIAQSSWVLQPSGTTTDLNSIYAASPSDVYTVGNNGVARITNDKGATWTNMNIGSSLNHYRIRFNGGLYMGTIVGANQEILTTNDGGVTWVNAGTGTTTLYDFSFHNGITEWIVGDVKNTYGFLFNTQTSRTITDPSTFNKAIRGIDKIPGSPPVISSIGYAVGDGGLILMNTGSTWTPVNSNTTIQLNKVAIHSSPTGGTVIMAVGNNGTILRGIGNFWYKMVSGTTANLNDIYFPDASNVYICGDNGTVLHGNYNGMVWQTEQTNTTATLKGIHGFGLNDIWICGTNGTILYKSSVSGISTEIRSKKLTANFFPNPATSYATLQVSGLKEGSGAQVQILNILGQVVQQYKIWNNSLLKIPTNSLNAGTYLYKVISLEDQSILTGKFLVD